MRVVCLADGVRNRELDLVCPDAIGFACSHQLEPWPQVQQNRRGLADHALAVDQHRAGKRWTQSRLVVQTMQQGRQPLPRCRVAARNIGVRRTDRFQRQADKFPAALQAGPVVELIGHRPWYPRIAQPCPPLRYPGGHPG